MLLSSSREVELTWVMSGGAEPEVELDTWGTYPEVELDTRGWSLSEEEAEILTEVAFLSWSVGKVWQDFVSELLLESFIVGWAQVLNCLQEEVKKSERAKKFDVVCKH